MRFPKISHAVLGLLLAATLALPSLPSLAQVRTLPAKAKRAVLSGYENPFVILGAERLRLAPGARIYDASNRTIVPMSLPKRADVVYTTDSTGSVMLIYLLTREESERLDQARR